MRVLVSKRRCNAACIEDGAMKRIFRPFGHMLSTNAGFFGWILLSNAICLGMIYFGYETKKDFDYLLFSLGAILWLVLILSTALLVIKKKVLLFSGMRIAVVLNAVVWVTMLIPKIELTSSQMLMIPILPLPAGLLILFSYIPG
jgi:hypothetical protein